MSEHVYRTTWGCREQKEPCTDMGCRRRDDARATSDVDRALLSEIHNDPNIRGYHFEIATTCAQGYIKDDLYYNHQKPRGRSTMV